MLTPRFKLSFLFSLLAACFGSGCVSVDKLPLVTATRIEYNRSSLVSSAHVLAENVHNDGNAITADKIVVSVTYPIVGTATLTVDGYRRGNAP